MYDADGDGKISKNEVLTFAKVLWRARGDNMDDFETVSHLMQLILDCFETADADRDGLLTLAEIQRASRDNPDLFASLFRVSFE